MEYLVLQNTRLNLVMRMADLIVQGLLNAIRYCCRETAFSEVAAVN
ncbi:MAG: spore protease YyaC, partial [Desulfotomaculales bacterium]